jgi:hypothetical protein
MVFGIRQVCACRKSSPPTLSSSLRMMFSDQLRAAGYRVLEAGNAEERWRGFVR